MNFAVDAIWAVFNLALGVVNESYWFVTLGAYYILFAIMRLIILSCMRQSVAFKSSLERFCGILLLLTIFVLSGITTLTSLHLGGYSYGDILAIAMAAFTTYSLTAAIVSFVKQRHNEDRLIVVNSRINLAIGLVSLLALEIALLSTFGTEEDALLQYVAPILTSTGITIVIAYLGIRTILDSRRSNSR